MENKYLIVGVPSMDARLVTATLFDLLGDPSLWTERFEDIKLYLPEGNVAWGEPLELIERVDRIQLPGLLDPSWTVLGPTDEPLVGEMTGFGAKYRALDEGLVELAVEEDAPPVAVVPDIEEKEEEVVAEVLEEAPVSAVAQEAPVRRGRGRPRKTAVAPTLTTEAPKAAAKKAEADKPITKAMVDAQYGELAATSNGIGVQTHLVELIRVYVGRIDDEAKLWALLDTVRKDA